MCVPNHDKLRKRMSHILLVQRAKRFSPNSEERDRAIITAVMERLREKGHDIVMIEETMVSTMEADPKQTLEECDIVLSMARDTVTLEWLARMEEKGKKVINSARALLRMNRRTILETAQREGVATPPHAIGPLEHCPLPYPVWWKRDDRTSQEIGDVVFVRNDVEWQEVRERDVQVQEYVVEQHLEGDLVKFYSVEGTPFFHWNYSEFSKFGNERQNTATRGFRFDYNGLKWQADRLAKAMGLSIYGGDAIVTENGTPHLIDLNDWPSFSSCREEGAEAIASLADNV